MRKNLFKRATLIGLLVLGLSVPGLTSFPLAFANPPEVATGSDQAWLPDLSEMELADIVSSNRPPDGVESKREAALAVLFERNFPFLRHWDPDIRSDVFEKVLKSVDSGSFYSGLGTFRGWLDGIRRNVEKDAIRRAKLRQNTDRDYAERDALLRDDDSRLRELRAWFMNELESMDTRFRAAAVLVYIHGFSHAEAAQMLSTKEGTISSRLHHVREALQKKATALGCERAFSSRKVRG